MRSQLPHQRLELLATGPGDHCRASRWPVPLEPIQEFEHFGDVVGRQFYEHKARQTRLIAVLAADQCLATLVNMPDFPQRNEPRARALRVARRRPTGRFARK